MREPASDFRIVWSGPSSDNLTVYAISENKSFTIPYFTEGKTIYGFGIYGNSNYDALASNITSISSSSQGSYTADFSSGSFTLSSMSVTYYLEAMGFSDGTVWNMQSGPLTFTAAVYDQHLYARDGYSDTLVAATTDDYLYGASRQQFDNCRSRRKPDQWHRHGYGCFRGRSFAEFQRRLDHGAHWRHGEY